MALSAPIGLFSVHQISFFDYTTGQPVDKSSIKVIGEASMNLAAEFADLVGGSNPYVFSSEVTTINPEVSLTFREYPMGFAQKTIGGQLTTNAAEASGAVAEWADENGTSMTDGSTGVTPQLTSGSVADLASGTYTLVATGAQAATLYCSTDVDFNKGNTKVYTDDTMAVATLDFSTAGDKTVANFGIEFTQAGTTALTVGDSATFVVRRANTGSETLKFGQSGATFTKVGVDMIAQQQSDGTQFLIRLYKATPAGLPMSMTEKAWSEASITFKAEYDTEKDGVGEIRRIDAA